MIAIKRARIVVYALLLLAEGLLPSQLPGRLMADFGLPPALARRLAGEALKRRKKQSKC